MTIEKLRRDWREHRRQVIVQIISGLACGLLSAMFGFYQDPNLLYPLAVFFLLYVTFGRIKKGEKENRNCGTV